MMAHKMEGRKLKEGKAGYKHFYVVKCVHFFLECYNEIYKDSALL